MSQIHGLFRRSIAAFLFAVSLVPNASAAEPRITVPVYNTLTDAEEVALGRKISIQLERQLKLVDSPLLQQYVSAIVDQLGRKSQRPNLRYVVKVIDSPVVNAVSLPGGFLYVYRGLLHKAQNESELVSVLAHEVGHIAGRHSANTMMLNIRARNLYELVKKNVLLENQIIAQVIEKLGGPLAVLAMLRYGREMEYEADLLGFYEMARAGWHPNGMVGFFERMGTMRGAESSVIEDLLSTHPAPRDRAGRIRTEMRTVRLPDSLAEDTMSFRAMKVGIGLLPPPPAERRAARD